MSKNDPDSNKRQQRAAARWALTIFLVTIAVSASISFASNEVMARSSMAVAFLILLVIVAVGILFDIIGVAVTSADEKPFHAMASRRVPGAKEAIRLLRSAGKVSSICNDVVGDICGVVSGAALSTGGAVSSGALSAPRPAAADSTTAITSAIYDSKIVRFILSSSSSA